MKIQRLTKDCLLTISLILLSNGCFNVQAQIKARKAETLNYCSVVGSPEKYLGKTVKVKALMTFSTVSRVDGGDPILFASKCNSGDFFATTNYTEVIDGHNIDAFFDKLAPEKNYVFEIIFLGKLEYSIVPVFGHLSWATNEFKISRVISIRDISSRRPSKRPNFELDTPKINLGLSLVARTKSFIYFLMDLERTTDISYGSDFRLIDQSAKSYISDQIDELRKRGVFDTVARANGSFFGTPTVRKEGGKYIATGKFGLNLESEKVASLRYECIYREIDGDFVLETVRLSKEEVKN